MCIYSVFHFVCGARKLKIVSPCSAFATNVQGLGFCRDDPVAHVDDGRNDVRSFVKETYGPGICSHVHCRQLFGLLPPNEYHASGAEDLTEDDEPFCMSDEARAEREDRWYRQMLSTDQQLELFSTAYPLNDDAVSSYSKYVLRDDGTLSQQEQQLGVESNPDHVDWRELNPRYLTEYGLWVCTSNLLPAFVTDTRYHAHQTSSPFQPSFGPFRVGTHSCKLKTGLCKVCGRYHEWKSGRNLLYHERNWVSSMAAVAHSTNVFLPHPKSLGYGCEEVDQNGHNPPADHAEQHDSSMSEA